MTNDRKRSHASRVLRFTVTSALVMAPMAGCGTPTHTSNPGPEVVVPNTNPGPEPTPEVATEIDAGVDAGEQTDAGPYSGRRGANPGPNGHGGATDTGIEDIRQRIHANPVAHDVQPVPVES